MSLRRGLLLLAALLLTLLAPAAAQFAPQPPLTTDACAADGSQLTCGPADGAHRCCAAQNSKCGTTDDGTPRCAFCQRSCAAGSGALAIHCPAGFKCGMGADGCAACVASTDGTGSFVRAPPPPRPQVPPPPQQKQPGPSQATTALGLPDQGVAGAGSKPLPPQAKPGAGQPAAPAKGPAATGCSPACRAGSTCARITPTRAAAALGATTSWRCVPAPVRQPAQPGAAISTGRRLLRDAGAGQ